MKLEELLKALVEKGGSDLHLKVGLSPVFRIKGDMMVSDFPRLTSEDLRTMVSQFIGTNETKKLELERELDISTSLEGIARFRGNLFFQQGKMGAVFRAIPLHISTIDDLNLPAILKELVLYKQGIILVTGPTGSGKSTALAAMIEHLNCTLQKHVITIEDPVEFIYEDKKCVINQREVGLDTLSFNQALKRALRQDPNVILVGEMRDKETISTAITAAETGHLVLSTLHTNDCKQTVDRVIDSFPAEQQTQVRLQFATTLVAVVAQRLIKRKDGQGRAAAMEVMINTPLIKKLIEDSKTGQIAKAIEDSASFYKTQSFNQSLFALVEKGIVDAEEALAASNNPNDLKIQLSTAKMATAGKAIG